MWHLLLYCFSSIRADSLRPKELILLPRNFPWIYALATSWGRSFPELPLFLWQASYATVACLSETVGWVGYHVYLSTPSYLFGDSSCISSLAYGIVHRCNRQGILRMNYSPANMPHRLVIHPTLPLSRWDAGLLPNLAKSQDCWYKILKKILFFAFFYFTYFGYWVSI